MKNLLYTLAFFIVGFVQAQDCTTSYVWTYIEWRGQQLWDCYTPVPNALCNDPNVIIYPTYWQCCSGSVDMPGFSLTPCQEQIGLEENKIDAPGGIYIDILGRGYDSYESIPDNVVFIHDGRIYIKLAK
tara:strand:- start:911 stop:1297 length:387 start_codon:yes stop_codon:yes gene_type:complete